jgi:predicted RNase H-like nuclease (RuvC/YqgF family)
MDTPLQNRLKGVHQKVKGLLDSNTRLKATNAELAEEVKLLKLALENEVSKSNELNNKIKIIKLAQNIGDSENPDKTELKRKINEYIKEIDNCIALLND